MFNFPGRWSDKNSKPRLGVFIAGALEFLLERGNESREEKRAFSRGGEGCAVFTSKLVLYLRRKIKKLIYNSSTGGGLIPADSVGQGGSLCGTYPGENFAKSK